MRVKIFSGLDLNKEGETLTDSSESRPWDKYTQFECSLKRVPISHVGTFSQNSVILTGLPMILPSESDLNYQCVVCSPRRLMRFFTTWYHIAYKIKS